VVVGEGCDCRFLEAAMQLPNWLSSRVFKLVHGNNLVYNTCWEDPRLDRVALRLGPDDVILVITSAGCNVLDYLLEGPQRIHAVDMNPRQNALLELKIAGIKTLEHSKFFSLFGRGRAWDAHDLYRKTLRPELSPSSQAFWDKGIEFFRGTGFRKSFYFHGTSGVFARMVNLYVDKVARIRDRIDALINANTVEEQKAIYDRHLKGVVFTKFVRWLVSRDGTLALLGVPRSQRLETERNYVGGIAQFMEDSIEAVFTKLPLKDNYFWRVYLTGEYTKECCPEYLKENNFQVLKAGMTDRISIHTGSILDVLNRHESLQVSRYVLLDHMDWLSSFSRPVLQQEWQAIINRAAPHCRVLWRAGGMKVDFVDPIEVELNGQPRRVGELLTYHPELAAELHEKDRVHTYGSFYIADLHTR
jgi:S-adenosylmethionine-diacylglycerol 3-amino-3-carboxypropyl transferase